MKNIKGIVFYVLIFVFCLGKSDFVFSQKKIDKVIVVGVYDNPPKIFIEKTGEPNGFFIDIIKEIGTRENLKFEYKFGTWDELYKMLQVGAIDILPDMGYSVERDSIFCLNKISVVSTWLELFTRTEIELNTILDLKDMRVGVLSGSIQENQMREIVVKELNIPVDILTYPNYSESVYALKSKEVDVIIADRFFAFSKLFDQTLIPTGIILRPTSLHFAFPKNGNPKLVELFDKNISSLKADAGSKYYKSLSFWLDKMPVSTIPIELKWLIAFILSVLVMALIFIFLLRNRVMVKTRELKLAKNKAEEREELLLKTARIGKVGGWEYDIDTYKLTWTNETYNIHEVDSNFDLTENSGLSFYTAKSKEIFISFLNKAIIHGISFDVELELITAKSNPRIVHVIGEKDKERDIIYGFIQDVTYDKQVELELLRAKENAERNEHNYRKLVEMIPDGVYSSSHEGKFLEVNMALVKMLGYDTPDELLAIDINRDLYVEMTDRDDFILDDLNKELGIYKVKKKDETEVWVEDHGWYVFDQNGEITLHHGVVRDATARKKAQDELIIAKEKAEESDRLKSAFLANMSHEIRTPMNSIIGFSRLLKRPNLSDGQRDTFISYIQNSGEVLMKLINDIIDISKIESSQLSIYKEDIKVNDLLTEIIVYYRNQHYRDGLYKFELNLPVDTDSLSIYTDKVRLRQLLNNLIDNAVNYGKSEVQVGYILSDKKTILFFVKDNGPGIPIDKFQLIFERFTQLNYVRNIGGKKGVGLGLSICKLIVENLDGKIWVESEQDKGSTFNFELPILKNGK